MKKTYYLRPSGSPIFSKLLVEEEYLTKDFSLTKRSGFPYYTGVAILLMGTGKDKKKVCYQQMFEDKDRANAMFDTIKDFIHNM